MSKPVLYIIHGWTYTVAPWARTLALLEKKGVKVEMLNVPGLTAPSKKVWTIADYVKWANRNIPDGAVALGHSNGGRILLNLCAEHPEKLKHLILLDAAGVYESSGKRDLARTLSKKLGFLKKIPGVAKLWHKLTGASDYARAPENMKRTLSNMLDSDRNLGLSKVTVPTSILWGAEDKVTPPHQAEVMHAQIPHSSLKIYPDWTHAPYLSHPDQLAKAIYEVLGHPPMMSEASKVDDTKATSAALALKKAPEPVLKANGPSSPVAPNVPTKLVLHTGESKLTDGLKVSDAEGAAVKYEPKKPEIATKTTNAGAVSAALALKHNKAEERPNAFAEISEQMPEVTNFMRLEGEPEVAASRKMATAQSARKVAGSAKRPTRPAVDLPGAITSASVPKVSRLEKAKRKLSKKTRPSTAKPRPARAAKPQQSAGKAA